jgi:hypothetical protein
MWNFLATRRGDFRVSVGLSCNKGGDFRVPVGLSCNKER